MMNETDDIIELFDEFYFIDEPSIKRVKENENPIKINFEGGNNQRLIFIHEGEFSVQDKDMLHKLIHNAMKLTMEDIAIVNVTQNEGIKLEDVINIMKPERAIIWGTGGWSKAFLPALNLYEISSTNGTNWLKVDSVEKFHDNVQLKTALWNGIQALLKK
jgi:DNA-binding protein YbaB